MAKGLLGNLRVRLTAETEDFRKGMNSARTNLKSFSSGIDKMKVGAVAGVAAISGLATGMFKLVSATADAADKIDKMAIRTGIARGTLQELEFAADQLGVSFDGIAGITESFTRRIPQIQEGTSDTAKAFRSLGIGLHDSTGNLRGMGELFPDVIRGLSEVENETQRNAIATQLFGRRAFELVPFLEAGADEIERLTGRAKDLGLVMSDSEVARLVAFKDRWSQVKMQLRAVWREIGIAVLPVFEALASALQGMLGWVNRAIAGWNEFKLKLMPIPALLNAIGHAARGNAGQAYIAWQQYKEAVEESEEAIRKFRESQNFTPSGPTNLPSIPLPDPEDTKDEGRKAAFLYFDGLAEEWERLRYNVALRSLDLTGGDGMRLALEEEHGLRLLDIEEQRIRALHKAKELTDKELAHQLRELAVRREIVKTRTKEFKTVDDALAKQQNLLDLAGSVGDLFPAGIGGPGGKIGSAAGKVAADHFPKLASLAGGLAGNLLLPGVGALIGTGIGSLFDRSEKEQQKQTQALQRIDQNTRRTATILELQRQLADASRGVVNVPSRFVVPPFTPPANVSLTVNMENHIEANDPSGVVESMRRELGPMLQEELRSVGIGR